jgi:7-cyano-7-deazaguanine synthase
VARRVVRSRGAVVLLSGGMDSATSLALAVRKLEEVHALTVIYGQRHEREIRSARALARYYRIRSHEILRFPRSTLFASTLTDRKRPIPEDLGHRPAGIPPTYVPARNTVLLSLALAYSESHALDQIFLGINAIDYSGYPDCRPEYLRAFQRLARLATKASVEDQRAVRVSAPLLRSTKAEIVRLGERIGVPWERTWSCYQGGARPCGRCDSCRLRATGFAEAGVIDPLVGTRR